MAYSPLRISTIKSNRNIPFDLFILYRETYLCYKPSGLALDDGLLGKLKKQRVAKFYITEEDEPKYQKFLDEILSETMSDSGIPTSEKADMAEGAASTAVEKMQRDPNSRVAYKMTEKAATTLTALVRNNPDALKLIFDRKVDENDEKVIKHSLNVSALATKLAAKLKCKEKEIENLAVAALVQFICISRVPDFKELFLKERSSLNAEQRLRYSAHPKESAMLLQDKEYINAEIIDLVMNHEETLQGTGPNKKKKLLLTEEILCLINRYDHRVTVSGRTPKEAFKEVQIDELGNFSLEMIDALKKLLLEEKLM